jgi:orotate phosphoribosyltransferase
MADGQLETAADPSGFGASDAREALHRVIVERSFRRGHFILSSGLESDLYFNLKATILDPRGGLLVARAFIDFARGRGADWMGGLALGAVPTLGAVAAVSALEGPPVRTFFVRQAAKSHGTRERIEGLSPEETLAGQRVVAVDDVATKGGSVLQAILAAREMGARVEAALVIIDREKGGEALLRENGVQLFSLFREADFL